jgi:hypothetical protein
MVRHFRELRIGACGIIGLFLDDNGRISNAIDME